MGGRERGAGSKPSGSRAGLSLSQMSCCQSPFRHSHYGASPELSDGSVPGASRGTGSQSGPASLQKGPVGERGQGRWKSQVRAVTLESAALGPYETCAQLLGHGNRGGHTTDSTQGDLCPGMSQHVHGPRKARLGPAFKRDALLTGKPVHRRRAPRTRQTGRRNPGLGLQ